MGLGDIVLVSLRDFQDGQCDIIERYSIEEARQLKNIGELPENAKINETTGLVDDEEGDVNFEFGAASDDEDGNNRNLDDLDIDDI